MDTQDIPKGMDTHQLATRLSLSYSSAARLMRSQGFPSMRYGDKWIVTEDAFQRWYSLNQGQNIKPVPEKTKRKNHASIKVWPKFDGNYHGGQQYATTNTRPQ